MKIFNNNLKNNLKTVFFNVKKDDKGKTKYLPSFSTEWKNTAYFFNKNTIKNIPVNDLNINKIIKAYFNLYFKAGAAQGRSALNTSVEDKPVSIEKRRNFLRRIHVSNAEIKHTNNKAIITLYTVNRENNLKNKYSKITATGKTLIEILIERYFVLHNDGIEKIYNILNKNSNNFFDQNDKTIIKKDFIKYKLQYLDKFIKYKNLYSKKIWSIVLNKYAEKYIELYKKYDLLYSLNKYKSEKLIFLSILSNILYKILGKKIEYNIVNLKSITYNTDIFTNALALKLRKKRINYINSMSSILNRANLPQVNLLRNKSLSDYTKLDIFRKKFKDLTIISNMDTVSASSALSSTNNFDRLLDKTYLTNISIDNNKLNCNYNNEGASSIHNKIYNSIEYKNITGIKLEVKGRLTKRYRADRSIYSFQSKGGLKNIDSFNKSLYSVLFRGNDKSNINYSITKSKRRIGAFAVKGWISGR